MTIYLVVSVPSAMTLPRIPTHRLRVLAYSLVLAAAFTAMLASPTTVRAETWSALSGAQAVPGSSTVGVADQAARPAVAYWTGTAVRVDAHDGTAWSQVGTDIAGFTSAANPRVIADGSTVAVAVWSFSSQKWVVLRWSGSAWTDLAVPALAAEGISDVSFDGTPTNPVIARTISTDTQLTIHRYNGTSWVTLPAQGTGANSLSTYDIHASGPQVYLTFLDGADLRTNHWTGSAWANTPSVSSSGGQSGVGIVAVDDQMFVSLRESSGVVRVVRRTNGAWTEVFTSTSVANGASFTSAKMRMIGGRPLLQFHFDDYGHEGVTGGMVLEWWGSGFVRVSGDYEDALPGASWALGLVQHLGRPALVVRDATGNLRVLAPQRDGPAALDDVTIPPITSSGTWLTYSGASGCGLYSGMVDASTTPHIADDVVSAPYVEGYCDSGGVLDEQTYQSSPLDPAAALLETVAPGPRLDVQSATDVRLRVNARKGSADADAVQLTLELRTAADVLLASVTTPALTSTPTIYQTPPVSATAAQLRGAKMRIIAEDTGDAVAGTRADVAAVNLDYDATTDHTVRLRPNSLSGSHYTLSSTGFGCNVETGRDDVISEEPEAPGTDFCAPGNMSTDDQVNSDGGVSVGFTTEALGTRRVTRVAALSAHTIDGSAALPLHSFTRTAGSIAVCDPYLSTFLACDSGVVDWGQADIDSLGQGFNWDFPLSDEFHIRAMAIDVLIDGPLVTVLAPPAAIRDGTATDVDGQTSTTAVSANWDAVSHVDFSQYQYCFTTSATGTNCAAGATVTWTATAATSVSVGSLSLTPGTTYYACVRSVHIDTTQTAATCSDGTTIDPTPPGTPTLVSPANLASVGVAPALTATYVDGQTSGRVQFQVCPTSSCSSITATGYSGVVANGANGAWTSTAAGGTWHWRARNVDAAGSTSAWSATWSYTFNAIPTVTLTSPIEAAWVTSNQPTLQARHDDTDGSFGTVTIETCLTNAASPWSSNCASGYQSMATTAGAIAPAGIASMQPNLPVAQGTSYWRARTVDTGGSASAWTAGRSIQVDSLAPAPSPIVTFVRKGKGRVDIEWTAGTDSGFGSVDYDVEVWNDGLGVWQPLCTTATLSCSKSGLGGDELLVARVRTCDGLNNCTAWVGGGAGANRGYIMRNVASTNLGNAQSRAATLTGGAIDMSSTSIAWGSGSAATRTGDFPFRYNTALGTKQTLDYVAPIDPQATPSGWGWVIDDVEGKWLPAGGMGISVVTQQTAGVAGTVGIRCRVWRVQTNGSTAMTSWTHIGDAVGSVANVLPGISGAMTSTCDLPNAFPTQTSFATNEVLYVEVVAQSTGASNGDVLNIHLNASTGSTIDIAEPGLRPDPPLLVTPADAAWVAQSPTLTTTYQHPTPRDGSVQVQVATDAGFASVVGTYATTTLAHGENGAVTPTGLAAGTTYYWRARGIDSGSLVGAWSSTRTFRTNQPPAAPVPTSPANGATIGPGPLALVAGAFSDPDTVSGDSHAASQWQVIVDGGAWSNPIADSGSTTGTSWTGPSLVSNTYRWRVRYQDSLGAWSAWSVERTVTINGGTTSIGVDTTVINMGLLTRDVDDFGSAAITVASTSPTGYTLSATDASDAVAMTCGCGTVADWTGTGADPTPWTAGVAGHAGITVRSATGGRLPKWGSGNATSEGDVDANLYAGLGSSVSTPLHAFGGPTTSDQVTATWRVNFGASNPDGAYSTTIVLSVMANP